MKTKQLIALAAGLLLSVGSVLAAGPKWMTNLDEAKKVALKENKHLLVDFTGSDWCGYCIKLEDEVFTKPEFAEFAKDYVLVRLDYPKRKKLSSSETKRNAEAAKKFKVQGYPTVYIINAKTDEVLGGGSGYSPGSGPKDYIKQFGDIKKPDAK